jgi:transcriptional regulator with XRE-family HTH domain
MLETETTFGTWLRQQRRHLDLTQTELASRVGYSVVTIRKLERDELRPSKQLAEQLAQFLAATPEQQAGIVAFARADAAAVLPFTALRTPTPNRALAAAYTFYRAHGRVERACPPSA